GHAEALHTIDAGGCAACELDDHHAVLGRGLALLLGLVSRGFGGKGGKDDGLAIGGELDGHAARFGRGTFFWRGVGHGRGTHTSGLALLLAGDEIANDDFAIAFLREETVGEKLAVVGKALSHDGFPTVVIVVVERTLGLGEEERRGDEEEEDAAGVKHGGYFTGIEKEPVGRAIVVCGPSGVVVSNG